MATLREFQMALQEKLEELRQREETICELEDELNEKDVTIERLRSELKRLRSMMGGNTSGQPPLLSVPSSGSTRSLQGRQSPHSYNTHRASDPTSGGTTLFPPSISTGGALPRFKLPPGPVSTSLKKTRMGLVKTYSADQPTLSSSSSSGESNENYLTVPK